MAIAKPQTLNFGPHYPKRPPYFFSRAIRLMSHYAVAQEVGLLGYAILVEIALSEDKRRYTSPPRWFKIALAERLDRQVEAVSEAIQRCVDNGWLVWHQPSNKVKATTWVMIPEWVDESAIKEWVEELQKPDRPENPANDPGNHPANHPGNHPANHPGNHPANHPGNHPANHPGNHPANHPGNHPANHPGNDPRSNIPNPILNPTPTPSESEGWAEVDRAMIEFGIREPSDPLRRLQEHNVEPGLALSVLRFATSAKRWKPGKVRRRLMCLLPGEDPSDLSKWMQPDFGQSHPAIQRPASDGIAARSVRLRQLEFEFKDELASLKDLTPAQIADRLELPSDVAARSKLFRPGDTPRNQNGSGWPCSRSSSDARKTQGSKPNADHDRGTGKELNDHRTSGRPAAGSWRLCADEGPPGADRGRDAAAAGDGPGLHF